ncbi:PAS domain S-box-containing protein/diguanylate cyclase (GGDEF)-like protein [Luteibacter rhizovicinus]|uniref:PAS domain S-box-containing protein/diguanylate cyclase (GGDEF)-like protein n=1 Tax=Luteibacter rhizovicinus TaxID=242606 RepID=A0A4R3YKR7_9GAMM|nr:GGDEF and EAL domain-containing protein [Luteibacter rhizovicinus]TCV92791.1 PAS domain S-box-containing protein/diguanylate cyclase (GGDEF)-like protein [Luteibacter rhizovicinus]
MAVGAEDGLASAARMRRFRHATWTVASIISVGLVVLVAAVQIDSYRSMLASARRQAEGVVGGVVRVVDIQIDATLGPLIALRNAIDGPAADPLHTRLAEVWARHPELSGFVALDDEGTVIARAGGSSTDWRPALRVPRGNMLGVPVRVAVAAGEDGTSAIRVIVDSNIPMPSSFGTEIDASRVRESLAHTGLGPHAAITVLSREGRRLVANRDDDRDAWDRSMSIPGATGTWDTLGADGRLYAYAASRTHPYVVLVGVDRMAIAGAWYRQALPSVLAALTLILLLIGFTVWLSRAYRGQGQLTQALERSARHLGHVQRIGHIGLWEMNLATGVITWSGEVHDITGVAKHLLAGELATYFTLVPPEDRQPLLDWLALFDHAQGPFELEHRLCRPDGTQAYVRLRGERTSDESGAAIIAGTVIDVTALHDAHSRLQATKVVADRELAASEARFRLLVEQMPLPLLIVRNGEIAFANRLAEDRLGHEGAMLVGRSAADFMDSDALAATDTYEVDGTRISAWLNPEIGAPFEAEMALSEYRDAQGRGTQIIVRDLTDQRRYEERLAHQATHDELTGLPNRRALQIRLDEMIVEAAARQTGLMLLFIDLDHFKFINDALGHILGDDVLRDVTLRLSDAIDDRGYVGRFGGDEFVAAIPFEGSAGRALDMLPVIQCAIEAPLIVAGTEQRLKCSIGVAFALRDGNDADTLIRNADTAMYDAKRKGRHTWRRYSSEMHDIAMARLAVLSRLSGVSLDHELSLHYQTQHAGADGRIIGVEALLRWPSGPGELSRADQLVPLLEETGAIVHIGKWVLREACRQQRAIADIVGYACRVAVNISAQQLVHTDLVALVAQVLTETGASADCLELELTESAFMTDPDRAIRTLRELKAMGVSIALDDFGTGYSNLTYLSRLPLDKIKIDRHFTSALLHDHVDASICRSIIFLAQSLRLGIIAEGVETEGQRAWLLAAGCDQMQGYLFSRPVPLERLADLATAGTSR